MKSGVDLSYNLLFKIKIFHLNKNLYARNL